MKFTEFELHAQIMKGIESAGFEDCTPIQESSIPLILEGKDVAGLAQTGTGKTAAYLLPLMDRILRSQEKGKEESASEDNGDEDSVDKRLYANWKPSNFILILVPTRELAEQVRENVKTLSVETELSAVAVYGGMSYEPQKKAINRGVQIVIATPGRLIDLFKEKVVDLNQVRAVVFDEADRMFDMGFKDDMKFILQRIPKTRQFLVYSATLNFDVLNVAYEFGSNPVEVNVSKDQTKAENVNDEIFHCGSAGKPQHLLSIIEMHSPRQAIVFSNFKSNVERIAKFLNSNGVPAMGISSLLTQSQRNRVMQQFKTENNNKNILVATDVAARGLDVKGVDIVVNYELPDDPENYVHRIGRTGRAGEVGKAFSLVGESDVEALARIESFMDNKLVIGWIETESLIQEFQEFPRDTYDRKKNYSKSKSQSKNRGGRRGGPGERRGGSGDGKSREGGGKGEGRHRDRVTGRHKNKHGKKRYDNESDETNPNSENTQAAKSGGRNNKNKNFKSKGGQKRRGKKKVYKHRPQKDRFDPNKKSAAPAQKGIGEKVSGFIKRLFS